MTSSGFHIVRFRGFALYDVLATLACASMLAGWKGGGTTSWFVLLVVLGELIHWILGVDTEGLRVIKKQWKKNKNRILLTKQNKQ